METTLQNIPRPQIKARKKQRGKIGTRISRASSKRPMTIPQNTCGMYGQIHNWMAQAFTLMGAPELIKRVPWKFNSRLTSVRGRAGCTWFNNQATDFYIEFSPSLMRQSDDAGRRQCVFHECAHIVDFYLGTHVQGKPHGASWKRLMRRGGVPPKRCHNVGVKKQRRTRRRRQPNRI